MVPHGATPYATFCTLTCWARRRPSNSPFACTLFQYTLKLNCKLYERLFFPGFSSLHVLKFLIWILILVWICHYSLFQYHTLYIQSVTFAFLFVCLFVCLFVYFSFCSSLFSHHYSSVLIVRPTPAKLKIRWYTIVPSWQLKHNVHTYFLGLS